MRETENSKSVDADGASAAVPLIERQQLSHRTFNKQDFRNCDFTNTNFKESRFEQCDFSYSEFHRAYFNGAVFELCDFTGCRFIDCNLNRSRMSLCNLKFSRFERSLLEPKEILSNLPKAPNLRRELLQSLQVNAVEIGAYRSQREFALEELAASMEHNRRAVLGGDDYYNKKYPTIHTKVGPLLTWLWLFIQDVVWGSGEKPGRMLQSLFGLLILFALINAIPVVSTIGWQESWFGFRSLGYVLTEFLALEADARFRGFDLIDYFIATSRFIYIGLFVAVVYRAAVHR